MFGYEVVCMGQRICNITADTCRVAEGIYGMMNEDDQALVAFGMLPKPITDILERQLKDKFDESFKEHSEYDPEGFDAFVTSLGLGRCEEACDSRKDFVRTVSKEVCKDIYGTALRAGKMVV